MAVRPMDEDFCTMVSKYLLRVAGIGKDVNTLKRVGRVMYRLWKAGVLEAISRRAEEEAEALCAEGETWRAGSGLIRLWERERLRLVDNLVLVPSITAVCGFLVNSHIGEKTLYGRGVRLVNDMWYHSPSATYNVFEAILQSGTNHSDPVPVSGFLLLDTGLYHALTAGPKIAAAVRSCPARFVDGVMDALDAPDRWLPEAISVRYACRQRY